MIYFFSFFIILSALGAVSTQRPVTSIFALIFAFLNASGLFILLGAEFMGMTLMIVYVGAVAVLFLFVVMMLPPLPVGKLCLSALFLMALIALPIILFFTPSSLNLPALPSSMHELGQVLYSDYLYPFELMGLILFVAMVGALMLTPRQKSKMKRQAHQIERSSVIKKVDVPLGKGL